MTTGHLFRFTSRLRGLFQTARKLTGRRQQRAPLGEEAPLQKAPGEAEGRLSHCKLCCLEDFQHPQLRLTLREVFAHELERFGPDFPSGCEYRKHWEVGMAVRSLGEGGALHPRAEILGVGAGNEPTLFWLTNKVARVFATDLYLEKASGAESVDSTILIDPGRYWPGPWNAKRLVVQHMNALELQYEDESFDGLFSSSSLEHFGSLDDIQCAASEMCRVLKPGGLCSLSTEFLLGGSTPGLPGVYMFDQATIEERIVGELPWSLVSPLDVSISQKTLATEQPSAPALKTLGRHVRRFGGVLFHRLEWNRYPHIVLRRRDLLWTSVHLCLRKAL